MPTVAEIIAMDMQSNEANYMRIYKSVLKDEYAKLPSAAKVNLLNRKLRRLADAKSTLDSLVRDQIQADARVALQLQKDSAAAARQNADLTSRAAVAGAKEVARKGDDFDAMIRKATVEGRGRVMSDALIDPTRGTATGTSVVDSTTTAREGVKDDIDKAMKEAYSSGVGETLNEVQRLAGLENAYKAAKDSFIAKYPGKVTPQDVALAMTEAFGFEPGVARLLMSDDGVGELLAVERGRATTTDIAAPQVGVAGVPTVPGQKTYADYVAEYPELSQQIAALEADLAVEEEELFGDISVLSPEDIERKAADIYTRLYGSRQNINRSDRLRDLQETIDNDLIRLNRQQRTGVIQAMPITGREKRVLIKLLDKPTRATGDDIKQVRELLDQALERSVDLHPDDVRELLPENITKGPLGKERVTFTGGKTRDIDDVTLDDLVQFYVETDPDIDRQQAIEMYQELDSNMRTLKEIAGRDPGNAQDIAGQLARSLREGAGLPVDEPTEAPVTPETADIILGADRVEEDDIMAAINKSPAPSATTAPEGTVPPVGDDVGGSLAALEATQAPAPTATIRQGATPAAPTLAPTTEEIVEDISFAPIASDDPDDTTDLLGDEEEILAPDISAELAAMGAADTSLPSVAEEKQAKRNETVALAGMTAAEIFKGIADKTATGLDLAKIAYDSYGPVKLAGTGIEQTASLTNDQLEQIYKLADADDQSADNIKAALRNIVGQETYDTKRQSQDLSTHVYQTLYNLRTGQINTTLE